METTNETTQNERLRTSSRNKEHNLRKPINQVNYNTTSMQPDTVFGSYNDLK